MSGYRSRPRCPTPRCCCTSAPRCQSTASSPERRRPCSSPTRTHASRSPTPRPIGPRRCTSAPRCQCIACCPLSTDLHRRSARRLPSSPPSRRRPHRRPSHPARRPSSRPRHPLALRPTHRPRRPPNRRPRRRTSRPRARRRRPHLHRPSTLPRASREPRYRSCTQPDRRPLATTRTRGADQDQHAWTTTPRVSRRGTNPNQPPYYRCTPCAPPWRLSRGFSQL
jgi:hypothetical protein